MKICISVDGTTILQGNWCLFCNNKKVHISNNREVNIIDIATPGEYELILTNNLHKNFFWYMLLWIGNLLIAPINILILNTDNDWCQRVIPTIVWKCKCNFQEDSNINIRIISSRIDGKSIPTCDIHFVSSQNCIMGTFYQKIYNRDSFAWEINKYLSKFFSFEIWAFALLYFIFWYVSFNNWCIVAAIVGALLIILFCIVTIYTVNKARIMKKHLRL